MVFKLCVLPPDIQEFYTCTLEDHAKSTEVKTEETLRLVERWEQHPPPIPVEAVDFAEKALQVHIIHLRICLCVCVC